MTNSSSDLRCSEVVLPVVFLGDMLLWRSWFGENVVNCRLGHRISSSEWNHPACSAVLILAKSSWRITAFCSEPLWLKEALF